ncbi:ABC transporter ATP-binding protein [Pedomonas mirosovicensis]|uniref:ABC transporter ATP-binding protein n=1 Tax=Pedomonas mirosovicensis TaxID=2908641 RepID=UPI002166EA5B|nr:ABC transporter ATP-binding protein [Pedomonas mirosovicensis]MCH8684627.1 ABC transporter ATP-binding protein [Pedomonas mirosovicensis]
MNAGGPLLRLEAVSRRFAGGVTAVDGVSLDVASGAFVTLLGASGSGKTTLLRLIAGLDQPTDGQIRWRDGAPPSLGYVFQSPTLLPWATVAENVALPLTLKGRRDDGAVTRALAAVGLGERADARPAELSGGMQMRVSIARALVGRPRLLLLDEPFAALDEITRDRLGALVQKLWREEGLTVVFVTHSTREAAFHATRAVVLERTPGRISTIIDLPDTGLRDRTSEAYFATCARLAEALARTMRGEADDA